MLLSSRGSFGSSSFASSRGLGVDAGVEVADFLLREFAHLGVRAAGHLGRLGALQLEPAEFAEARRDRFEAGVLDGKILEAARLADHVGVGEQRAHLLESLDGLLEPSPDGILHQSRSRW